MRTLRSEMLLYSVLGFAAMGLAVQAQTYTFSTLHSFKNDGTDPQFPEASLIVDAAGSLYGTSSGGGTNHIECGSGCGTVFKLSKTGVLSVLHYFVNAPDGEIPQTSLFRDSEGNLYGTTIDGGTGGCGTVFKITPSHVESVLYNFVCGSDGGQPSSVIVDAAGNIYGTSKTNNLDGLVFKIDPSHILTVLHAFCSRTACADGQDPEAGVVRDAAGNLYGTTFHGGPDLSPTGVAFKLTANGSETILHAFGFRLGDGFNPAQNLIQDNKGNLYGVTPNGGAHDPNFETGLGGTLFKQAEAGGPETVLYSFCGLPNCRDGNFPVGPVAMDASGSFYGTTRSSAHGGTVWRVNPQGRETVLHYFPPNVEINSGVVIDSAGNLYGTTFNGGSAGLGSVYKLTLLK